MLHKDTGHAGATAPGLALPPPPGSRRRRLWEFDGHAHCPVVGVCLPIAALRRVVDKALGGQAVADDYELHCGVITDCQHRSPIAEALQRDLDLRYRVAVRRSAQAKCTDTLAAWWTQALRSQGLGGALWATLTHPRCTPALQYRVLGEVHMLQHQAGMAARVDLDRFDALVEENKALAEELAEARQRSARQAADHARHADEHQALTLQLRAQLMASRTAIDQWRDELQTLAAATPDLKTRFDLTHEVHGLRERLTELQRVASHAQQEAERQRRRADDLAAELRQRNAAAAPPRPDDAPICLNAQAVLCVGGRPAAVPLYRHVVERVGGRFLHHDGGEEDSNARLDATLASADLVICQTGCISHNAYWRVKEHCKRTGKRCVFVETPSTAGLKRALIQFAPALAALASMPTDIEP